MRQRETATGPGPRHRRQRYFVLWLIGRQRAPRTHFFWHTTTARRGGHHHTGTAHPRPRRPMYVFRGRAKPDAI